MKREKRIEDKSEGIEEWEGEKDRREEKMDKNKEKRNTDEAKGIKENAIKEGMG